MGNRVGAAIAIVALLMMAGCTFSSDDESTTSSATGQGVPNAKAPSQGLKPDALSTPDFGQLPKMRDYVQSSKDGVLLYVEVYLPDGPGPWPTIMINSPYNTHGVNAELDIEGTFRDEYVPRGYAVVTADVRGTGDSEGCMNMMGHKEQYDTYDLVEWIAAQPWSDGHVGMYGVSYVGTTPHEALIMAPPHLDTVVTVAGVTNQWRNTFLNGVPYANRFYPLTYEVLEGAPPPGDVERGPAWALNSAAGACEQEEAIGAMSPGTYEKGVYDSYWDERNFTTRASDVRASFFYNQGYHDRAVNPMESVFWLNQIDAPKKAIVGPWGHQTPPRDDWIDLRLAWFDHWLKGKDTGIMETPTIEAHNNADTIRTDGQTWPPENTENLRLHLSIDDALVWSEPQPTMYVYEAGRAAGATTYPNELSFTSPPLTEPVHVAGLPMVHLQGAIEEGGNTYWLTDLYDVAPDGVRSRLTEGWMNAHLWKSFDESNPLEPGLGYTFDFRMEPLEYVFAEGHRIGFGFQGSDTRVAPYDAVRVLNVVVTGQAADSWIDLPVIADPVTFSAEGV